MVFGNVIFNMEIIEEDETLSLVITELLNKILKIGDFKDFSVNFIDETSSKKIIEFNVKLINNIIEIRLIRSNNIVKEKIENLIKNKFKLNKIQLNLGKNIIIAKEKNNIHWNYKEIDLDTINKKIRNVSIEDEFSIYTLQDDSIVVKIDKTRLNKENFWKKINNLKNTYNDCYMKIVGPEYLVNYLFL
jgi:hypothetical protein